MILNEYVNPEHALAYLARADQIPHRTEGEGVLLSFIPSDARRILDLGTGAGRLLSLLLVHCRNAECVGIDNSPTMIDAARDRFRETPRVQILEHDLGLSLSELGTFDVVVSSFAIHYSTNDRKKSLYSEIFDLLTPGGVFCNLEHVASSTPALHQKFLDALSITAVEEDKSNILLDVESQLDWLRRIGFDDVDCYWKWLELGLFGGVKPREGETLSVGPGLHRIYLNANSSACGSSSMLPRPNSDRNRFDVE